MKNIAILLFAVLCLQACQDDKDNVDWTVDSLTITATNYLQEAGDGNWKVTLPTEFSGNLKIDIQSSHPWNAVIDDITFQQEAWLALSAESGEGNGSLDMIVSLNRTNADRKASVVITTEGNVPVKKTITIEQGNIDDLLSLSIDTESFPKNVTAKIKQDGSWDIILPEDFEGELFGLKVLGKGTWESELSFPNEQVKDWISTTAPASRVAINTEDVKLYVTSNSDKIYREAAITFTASSGELSETRKFVITQLGVEHIVWSDVYYQDGNGASPEKAELILPSSALTDVEIGKLESIKEDDLDVISLPEGMSLSISDSKLLLSTTENSATNKEITGIIELKNNASDVTHKVNVRQCIPGYGITLNKKLWSVEFEDNPTFELNGTLNKLYDNTWSNAEQPNLYLEIKTISNKPGCSIIIDLGENPHEYTHIGLLPRLEWVEQSPRTVKVEYSSDGLFWDSGYDGNAFVESDLYINGERADANVLRNQWDCKLIRWFEISDSKINDRFVKVTFVKSWYGNLGRIFSFDEFFISDKSANQE